MSRHRHRLKGTRIVPAEDDPPDSTPSHRYHTCYETWWLDLRIIDCEIVIYGLPSQSPAPISRALYELIECDTIGGFWGGGRANSFASRLLLSVGSPGRMDRPTSHNSAAWTTISHTTINAATNAIVHNGRRFRRGRYLG